jgi:transmembrane sensor
VAGATLIWRLTRTEDSGSPAATFTTGPGQTDSVPLPDGSLAVLGPSTRLTVLARYGAESRRVSLEGEALFDVGHDEARPFAVRAGSAEITDLGTRFSVRTGSEGVQVVVESGSVRVQDTLPGSTRAMVLQAGQAGVLPRDREVGPRPRPRAELDLAWLRGELVFEDATMARVREELRRWFGIELVVADSTLESRHFTARFAGESRDQVLRVLELSLGAAIERRGDTAIVRAGPTRRPVP